MTPYNAQGRGVLQIMILSVQGLLSILPTDNDLYKNKHIYKSIHTMATMISFFMSELINGLFKNKDSQGKKAVDRLLHASG